MSVQNNEQQLNDSVNELKAAVRALRDALNQLDDQKEEAFSKKNALGKQIVELITLNTKLRAERDAITDEVKKAKVERKKFNETIRQSIEKAKKLHQEKKDVAKKHGFQHNPGRLKEQMDKLEEKIITDVVSFEKEKELMKKIKEIKKVYDQNKKVSKIWEETHTLSKDIDTTKDTADELHKQIQAKAQQSQEKHERILENRKKIDALRKEEDVFKKDIAEKKAEIKKLSEQLKEKLSALGKRGEEITKKRKQTAHDRTAQRKKSLADLRKAVDEKIKKGEKLTTEDLLILQSEE